MKTYEVLFDTRELTGYTQGRISGIIYALTGLPEKEKSYPWRVDGYDVTKRYEATDVQHAAIMDAINKTYPSAFMGVRVVE